MNELQQAFTALYPEKQIPRLSLRYSGKFKGYGANVHITSRGRTFLHLEFRLAKNFQEVDESIRIGVFQELLNKIYKTSISTLEQELYHSFLDALARYTPQVVEDSFLRTRFDVLNEQYFSGLLDVPNLLFGKPATTVLGHYNYTTDTITISPVLFERKDLLDFVLYHEMLHKKHGIRKTKSGRNHYHTPEFRRDEKKFHIPNIEQQLEKFIKRKKYGRLLSWF